jgi:hypothetical protein
MVQILLSLIAAAAFAAPSPAPVVALHPECVEAICFDDGRGTPYVVTKSDNICGLDEPRQLTKPAVVDYQALLEATDEHKKLIKDKIDETSSEGITLMTKARARVLKACEAVRASQGHCSVWKVIKRRDKRSIDDITDEVKRQL